MEKTGEMSVRHDSAAASSSRRNRWHVSRSSWQGRALDSEAVPFASGEDRARTGASSWPQEVSRGQQAERTSGRRRHDGTEHIGSGNRYPSRHTKFPTKDWLVELLSLGREDAEETLLSLGFGDEDPDSVARVPQRFLQAPSRAQGISADLLQQTLARRNDQDHLIILDRFKLAHKLPAHFFTMNLAEWDAGAGNPASREFHLEPMSGSTQSRASPCQKVVGGDNDANERRCGRHSGRAWLIRQLRRSVSWQSVVEEPTVPSHNVNQSSCHSLDVWADIESPESSPTEQEVFQKTGHNECLSKATSEQNLDRTTLNSYTERDDVQKYVDAQELPESDGFVRQKCVVRSVGRPFRKKSKEYSNDGMEDFEELSRDENACLTDKRAVPLVPPPRRDGNGDGGCHTDELGPAGAPQEADDANSGGASCPGGHLPQSLQHDDACRKDSFEMDEVRSEDGEGMHGACVDGSSGAEADLVRTSSVQSDSSGYSEEPAGDQTPALPPPPPPPPSGDVTDSAETWILE
ncbi:protein ITPRID2-like isoform X1 [Lampetra planeri]